MNTPIKRLFICATSVIALASCGGGNDVASGGAGTGVTSASAVAAGGPNSGSANSAGQYGYIATADIYLAFSKAMTASSLTAQSILNISNATDRAKFFTLLNTAIQNLQSSLINTNFSGFNAITQTTFLSSVSSTPQINPAIAK